MKSFTGLMLAILLVASAAFADSAERQKQNERLRDAGQVMSDVINMPDSIPQDVLDHTRCVVVIPSVLKAAFVVGGSYGRGAMVCRTGKAFVGPWGAPSMVTLAGGSFGFQIGAEATDFVFLIMNQHGAKSLLEDNFKLGGDVSAAAGPVGRTAEADTDAYMRAEVLTYSRSRGLFAGASLEGAVLHPDNDANEALYGRRISAEHIVFSPSLEPPHSAHTLDALLDKVTPKANYA